MSVTEQIESFKFGHTPIETKALVNVGCGFDIPTGSYVTGKHGESILNGGCGYFVVVAGGANNYKTAVMFYMMTTLMERLGYYTSGNFYDTEENAFIESLNRLLLQNPNVTDPDMINSNRLLITDKVLYSGNEFFEKLKSDLESKASDKKNKITLPFVDRLGNNIKVHLPTTSAIDSISDFSSDDVDDQLDDNELGSSKQQTAHMKQGLVKTNMIVRIPQLCGRTNNYMFMTAQVGTKIEMNPMQPSAKQLTHMKQGEIIKGCSSKLISLANVTWAARNARVFNNQRTKMPEYPKTNVDGVEGDTDLMAVNYQTWRSKTGPSAYTLELIISQKDGLLPTLTEFNLMKSSNRFGISGNEMNYFSPFLPDVKLSRTVLRSKIDTNERLRRAINISSEMCQLKELHRHEELMCTPEQLVQDLVAKGYNIEQLLDTVGWWSPLEANQPKPFLSTLDLLKMRAGTYHPYWMSNT